MSLDSVMGSLCPLAFVLFVCVFVGAASAVGSID